MTQIGLICTKLEFISGFFPILFTFVPMILNITLSFQQDFFHFCADDSEDFDSLLKNFVLKSAGGKLSGFILGIAHRFLMA